MIPLCVVTGMIYDMNVPCGGGVSRTSLARYLRSLRESPRARSGFDDNESQLDIRL